MENEWKQKEICKLKAGTYEVVELKWINSIKSNDLV